MLNVTPAEPAKHDIIVCGVCFMFVCRKQHSLWVQGDVHRSKQKMVQQRLSRQQQLQQQQLHRSDSVQGGKQGPVSSLLSSMDDLSINTVLCRSYSTDEVSGVTS